MADYIQESEEKLKAARVRLRKSREMKQLKSSAPTLFEIIDGEISLIINKAFSSTPVSHDEYLDLHGQHRGIMRIRNIIDSKEAEETQASQEVKAIEENIKLIKNNV